MGEKEIVLFWYMEDARKFISMQIEKMRKIKYVIYMFTGNKIFDKYCVRMCVLTNANCIRY